MPLSSSAVAGAGTGRVPWAVVIVPEPRFTGEALHLGDAEQFETDDRADDVHDRIDRADFVEMDLVGRRAVHLCLCFGKTFEYGHAFFLDRMRRARRHP